MRLKGRQGRFLGATVGGWAAVRAWLLWPGAPIAVGGALLTALPLVQVDRPHFSEPPPFRPAAGPRRARPGPVFVRAAPVAERPATIAQPAPFSYLVERTRADRTLLLAYEGAYGASPQTLLRRAVYADRAPAPPVSPHALPARSSGRRVEAQAYLFVRPGSGRATLAPGGSLGGSQAAARVAVALNPSGPIKLAAAARLYAPLHGRGAEAAVGIDWHPLPDLPLRVSVERRIGLDAAGRHAFSAYVAGGFYAGHLPLGLEADGYAQGGIVGLARRDLFADGAVRLGRRVALGRAELVAGAGAWGAAQPGAERLDVGPRMAVSLPVERHRLTFAIEGRMRVAGQAAPGSGAAMTLAADF